MLLMKVLYLCSYKCICVYFCDTPC